MLMEAVFCAVRAVRQAQSAMWAESEMKAMSAGCGLFIV